MALALLGELPCELQAVLRARVLEERPYDEIAREQRTSEAAVRQRVSRALDRVGGAGVGCFSTQDVRDGRAWQSLGRRGTFIVPDGVGRVRVEHRGGVTVEAGVHDDLALYTAPRRLGGWTRVTWLDAKGVPTRTIEAGAFRTGCRGAAGRSRPARVGAAPSGGSRSAARASARTSGSSPICASEASAGRSYSSCGSSARRAPAGATCATGSRDLGPAAAHLVADADRLAVHRRLRSRPAGAPATTPGRSSPTGAPSGRSAYASRSEPSTSLKGV